MEVKWETSPGSYIQRLYLRPTDQHSGITSTTSDVIHDATTANTSYAIGISTTLLKVYLYNNGWAIDHQYNQGSWGDNSILYWITANSTSVNEYDSG
jgi:hypothetical protein